MTPPPKISIIIPVYNEEAILETAVRSLAARLNKTAWSYDLILAENGSTDATAQIAESLAQEISHIRVLHVDEPNYGRALKNGILEALGDVVICDEVDLGDLDFYKRALCEIENGAYFVVGSKRHPESMDGRPWLRRQGTAVINALLGITLNFKGSDTHGLKAFRRDPLLPVVQACTIEHHLFASELVIRARLEGFDVREIPLKLREIRPPSKAFLGRVPSALMDLGRLVYTIRIKK